MGLEIGIVGLPNVGKSTLFRALTKAKAEVANYPFCTIDPNIGIVPVKDPRLERLVELVQPNKVVPSTLRVVDIAGLVKGASQGEGLGNQFLSHIRQIDAILHVVRCFDDENITHVSGKVDPLSDIEIVQTELILADLEQVERKLERISRQAKSDKALAETLPVYHKIEAHLGEGKLARNCDLTEEEKALVNELNLITFKPYLYIANVQEEGLLKVLPHEKLLLEHAEKEGVDVIKICAQIESELSEMEEAEAQVFMEDLGISRSGLVQLTQAGYRLLKQITFFTAGKVEVRAWNVTSGILAPQAAGKIHSDFERGFIRAEIYHYDDINELGSESAVKEAGRFRLEGKDYPIKNGDIVHFRFNV
ncbi:redox-regulated ATPase YchF [Deltaproteobacteria bacterium TL4]